MPGGMRRTGMAPEYVARSFVPGDPAKGEGAQHPATAEPFECDTESREGPGVIRFLQKNCLWPADKATAELAQVPFVAVSVKDGVAVPSAGSVEKPRTRSAKDEV